MNTWRIFRISQKSSKKKKSGFFAQSSEVRLPTRYLFLFFGGVIMSLAIGPIIRLYPFMIIAFLSRLFVSPKGWARRTMDLYHNCFTLAVAKNEFLVWCIVCNCCHHAPRFVRIDHASHAWKGENEWFEVDEVLGRVIFLDCF